MGFKDIFSILQPSIFCRWIFFIVFHFQTDFYYDGVPLPQASTSVLWRRRVAKQGARSSAWSLKPRPQQAVAIARRILNHRPKLLHQPNKHIAPFLDAKMLKIKHLSVIHISLWFCKCWYSNITLLITKRGYDNLGEFTQTHYLLHYFLDSVLLWSSRFIDFKQK